MRWSEFTASAGDLAVREEERARTLAPDAAPTPVDCAR
jgi:hypothetical protein